MEIIMKKFFKLFGCLSVVLPLALCFSACNLTSEEEETENNTPPNIEEETIDVSAPYILSLGDFIIWEPSRNADEYLVYCDEELVMTTEDTRVEVDDLSEDHIYTVVARNIEYDELSEESNEAVVSKNSNFADNEVLDLSGQNIGSIYTIRSSIRKVICKAETPQVYNTTFILDRRKNDIIFELENVTFQSKDEAVISTYDGTYSRAREDWNLILDISGECGIDGIAQTEVPQQPENNTEQRGYSGLAGTSGIIAPTVVVRGEGYIDVIGGNGGQGGQGADSTFFAAKFYGDGGNGGKGGDGIATQYFVLQMESTGVVRVRAGNGGNGGSPGSNGSIITGPWSTSDYSEHYGLDGADGTTIRGEVITLGGTLYEEQ